MTKKTRRLGITLILAFPIMLMVGCDKTSTSPKHYVDDNWSQADVTRGGLLYDKWWTVNESSTPTTNFNPLWDSQTTNTRAGGDTWRCKECHGWDYRGKDGRYSSGSHYTGFAGVYDASDLTAAAIFDAIKDEDGDHDLSTVMSDADIQDLAKFIKDGLIDMSQYIGPDKNALGSSTAGQAKYNTNCALCHGANGLALDFDADDGTQGVSFLSNDNPQEVFHKIRWGNPGTDMTGMVDKGLTNEDMSDILAYCQTLPLTLNDAANIVRGGLLYDKWWTVNSGTTPSTSFDPIWTTQSTNTRTGADTWRCKECHGWDYKGKDGAYSSGSHYTGFTGVYDVRTSSPADIYTSVLGTGTDHDLSAVLSEQDASDLALFISEGLIDVSLYINYSTKLSNGNTTDGGALYATYCESCHGSDGNTIDFDDDDGSQGVGFLSNDNPYEVLHKIRWGNPASIMPSMVNLGVSDANINDILAYCQTLP